MEELFWQYIVKLYRNIPTEVYEGLASIFSISVVIVLSCWGLRKGVQKIARLILIEYSFLIYSSTVFFRQIKESANHCFIPFWSYDAIQNGRNDLLVENVMNIVVFIPIGLLLGCSFRSINWWKVLLCGGTMSFTIELFQLFTQRGFSELDDVIHNTIGSVIGYGIFKFCQMIKLAGV